MTERPSAGQRLSEPIAICVLGSTGSVGCQTLEVVRAYPERFRVVALGAGANAELMARQVDEFRPAAAALADAEAARRLRQMLPSGVCVQVLDGPGAMAELARLPQVDTVVAAVVGQAGLEGVYAAVRSGKRVALANKEALVMAGELIVKLARQHGASLVPVDSEHASLSQLLQTLDPGQVQRVTLTASGGPFLGMGPEQLSEVHASDALAHPNWNMGVKISVDSASMMNKGFEIIEARWLFDLPTERIDVLIHPESLIHALVELLDGSLVAHLASPDMRLPIAWALGHPGRLDLGKRLPRIAPLDLAKSGRLTFLPADEKSYPALSLCRRALRRGGGAPAALSVADEVVVDAFLAGRISFSAITDLLTEVLERYEPMPTDTLTQVLAAGQAGGRLAAECVERRTAITS